eukprot:8624637-Alexandrium_andersonii.AAC.1
MAANLRLFVDGSGERKSCSELNRAAWAAVAIDAYGDLMGFARGPVWASIGAQTSGAAEMVAVAAAVDLADGGNTIATDYYAAYKA